MKLLYKNIEIGCVDEVFESDGTWVGTFHAAANDIDDINVCGIRKFIAFCEEWNASQETNEPRNADEFNDYSHFIGDGLWEMNDGDVRWPISQSPNFLGAGEVSWTVETAGQTPSCAKSLTTTLPKES
jgi:hypothetical protein